MEGHLTPMMRKWSLIVKNLNWACAMIPLDSVKQVYYLYRCPSILD
uniref:Uncharacterized protein n=1 Tax=Rhizophora mucronata TaxID=61149 RepID=A0A2P2MZG7_RHIMU